LVLVLGRRVDNDGQAEAEKNRNTEQFPQTEAGFTIKEQCACVWLFLD
jgi:hypothetical protein